MDLYLLTSITLVLSIAAAHPIPLRGKNRSTDNGPNKRNPILQDLKQNLWQEFKNDYDLPKRSEIPKMENALFSLKGHITEDSEKSNPSANSVILEAMKSILESKPSGVKAIRPRGAAGRWRRSAGRHRRERGHGAGPRSEQDKINELCREVCR